MLDFGCNPNANISSLVQDALKYLDTRTEFWRQQKPMTYVNKSHKKLIREINARNYLKIQEKEKESKVRIQNIEKAKLPKAVPVKPFYPSKDARVRRPLDEPIAKRDVKT